ncbi:MAG: NADH:ubiquinone oxidoreductase [Chloroflexi bacterium]|nr:NADH:ubiquinone oxidoreductase [Chloroflexota bacterium]
METPVAVKPKIAFFDFTSCEGCQLTVVDSLADHIELLSVVEIVQFREAMSERGEDYQIAFIEGSCTRPSDEPRLKAIREQADIVVALGACAHLGGINSIRNRQPLQDVRAYVYGEEAELFETYPARPISAVIDVDVSIPGCPINPREFVQTVKMLLQGRQPEPPDYPLCIECKSLENVCVYLRGKTCLGPITRAGCDAICPAYGDGCEGCRGIISNPNYEAMKAVLDWHGLDMAEVEAKTTMFLTYQTMNMDEKKENGHGH